MILFSHPTGNSNVRNALHALNAAGLLKEFWTCVAWDAGSRVNSFLPRPIKSQLCRRSFEKSLLQVTRNRPWREAGRLLSEALHLKKMTVHESGPFSVDAVYRDLDTAVARRLSKLNDVSAVYAYEDGALETFREANMRGLECIYDLPIGYWRAGLKIQQEEALRKPEWASTLVATKDSEEKLRRKDEELLLANRVIVASQFTKQTLKSAPEFSAQIDVIPYGAPEPDSTAPPHCHRKLRALFVGSLSQRKGLSYLFDAIDSLKKYVDLTIVGRECGTCPALDSELTKHTWIPSLPQPQVWEQMRQHDILIFPSLFEGFGLVLLEAMARGMIVITTPNTAGPDFIDHDVNGFIVPIRSSDSIVQSISTLLHDRQKLCAMSNAALQKARMMTWQGYQSRLVEAVRSSIEAAV